MADPADVAGDVAANAAGDDDLVGPAGKELLDHAAAARQQAVRVAPLRHAFARKVGERKGVTLQHRDGVIEIRKRTCGQQARHAGPDHHCPFADPLHHDAPLRRVR